MILSVAGWGFQFLGHAIEGNQPAFFRDPRHLIIGPLFFLRLPLLRLRTLVAGRASSGGEDRQSRPTSKR
jgi:uncharacterized membrane protein YGL010W